MSHQCTYSKNGTKCGFWLPDEYPLPFCPWHLADTIHDAGPAAQVAGLAVAGVGVTVLVGAFAWRWVKTRRERTGSDVSESDMSPGPSQNGNIIYVDFDHKSQSTSRESTKRAAGS
jgi:hypothetical protein